MAFLEVFLKDYAHSIIFESMSNSLAPEQDTMSVLSQSVNSAYLQREVQYDIYLPGELPFSEPVSLLLCNDGQDMAKMGFAGILQELIRQDCLHPLVCIGIHCGADRKMEYGTAYSADFKGRGARAGLYAKFVMDELLPAIRKTLSITSFRDKSFAGFSLGALSALDIVWNHPNEFRQVGIFSGSLWWRRKGYEEGYNDEQDRLMHLQIRQGGFYPWLRFFVECGELDEKADRNNNGVIDSIDDALDLLVELRAKGYTDAHLSYLQLPEGDHSVGTWAKAFPDFLKWGWGK